jgi:hypothetical protein
VKTWFKNKKNNSNLKTLLKLDLLFFIQEKGKKKKTLIEVLSLNEPIDTYIDFFDHWNRTNQ